LRRKLTYCPYCGTKFEEKKDGKVKRRWCNKCGDFFYDNPLVGTAVAVTRGSELLLIKRIIHPGKGFWALPGGFVEQGETVEKAALRELYEETGIKGRAAFIETVYTEKSFIYGTVIVPVVRVNRFSGSPRPGKDELEAKFFDIKKLPLLAFLSHNRFVKTLKKQGAK